MNATPINSDHQAKLFAAWTTSRGLVVQLARELTKAADPAELMVDLTGALKAEELARADFARCVAMSEKGA